MNKIILVSPFPPSQNPRLVKEYQILKAHGYNVKVFFGEKDKWASELVENTNPNFIRVGGRHGSFAHFLTRIVHKILIFVGPVEWSYNRVSWFIFHAAKKTKADLYIGHNLAALPIIAKLAKKNGAKYSFDAEDFYRQTDNDDLSGRAFRDAKYLEDKYLANASYFTAASPLIAKAYKTLYPDLDPLVINNVFTNPLNDQDMMDNGTSLQLKLFWFSQTIGRDRGIQTVIEALGLLKYKNISLTLLGNIDPKNKTYFLNLIKENQLNGDQLVFLAPVEPDEIFKIGTKYDLGLALEPGFCLNNKLALSNKLFTYITCGLAVLATDTIAQKEFFEKHPAIGKIFPIDDIMSLASIIKFYLLNPTALKDARTNAKLLARNELNWEIESQKFLHVIARTLEN